MHIYSWPISVKVAEYGWNKRRISVDYNQGSARVPGSEAATPKGSAKYTQPVFRNVQEPRIDIQGGGRKQDIRSFAEAVTNNRFGNTETRVLRSDLSHNMSWFGSNKDEEWLMRSAVGELKEFNNIEHVNKKLESRGFIFSLGQIGQRKDLDFGSGGVQDFVCDQSERKAGSLYSATGGGFSDSVYGLGYSISGLESPTKESDFPYTEDAEGSKDRMMERGECQ
ncbi:hypothetical protein Q3G72_009870 [Acer saccharum]|nr:hypothetical protein Q3G72_009870 [Acer saccharum]